MAQDKKNKIKISGNSKEVGELQYIQLVTGSNHDSKFFKKWETEV